MDLKGLYAYSRLFDFQTYQRLVMILNEQVMKRIMLDQSYNWAKSCPVPHLHFIFEMLFWPGVNMLIVYVECVNGSTGSCVLYTTAGGQG